MIRSITFTFFVRLIAAVLNFLVIVLLSRELGPEGKGFCTRYLTIISNALIFCDFIGGPPLVFLSARYSVGSILLPSYLWSAVTSVFTTYVFFLFDQFTSNELYILMILSFLNSCVAIHQNILSGKMKFSRLNTIILVQSVVLFFVLRYLFEITTSVFELTPSPIHYLLALGVSYGIAALVGFFFLLTLEKSGEIITFVKFFVQAFRYGFVNILGHLLQFINQRLSYFLLNPNSLGVYSNATSVGESLWLVSNSIATVQYGKISNTTQKEEAEKLSLFFLKLNFVLSCLAGLVLFFLQDSFFLWLFGNSFAGIHEILLYLVPGLIFYSGYLILGHHFSGRGEFYKNLICILAGLLFTATGVGLIFITNKGYTVYIAGAITSLAYMANFFVALFLFQRESVFTLKQFLINREDLVFLLRGFKKESDKTD